MNAMVEIRTNRRRQAAQASRERILHAAEKLFSEQGLDGVSVREIAGVARLDVAMIKYHFGSKLGLYRAVFQRRIEGLTEQRLAGLENVLAQRAGGPPPLEDIVHALVAPNIRLRSDPGLGGIPFARLIIREVTDPNERQRGIMSAAFDETAYRYLEALAMVFPAAPRPELQWAYHFAIGTLIQTMASTGRLEHLSRGACQMSDPDVILARLVPFVVAGLRGVLDKYQSSPPKRAAPKAKAAAKSP
jgi:AcrR family transcriptional regulator